MAANRHARAGPNTIGLQTLQVRDIVLPTSILAIVCQMSTLLLGQQLREFAS